MIFLVKLKKIAIRNVIRVFSFGLFLIVVTAYGQDENRVLKGVVITSKGLEVTVSDGKYLITPYTQNIMEATFLSRGERMSDASHAVVLSAQPKLATFKKSNDTTWYRTDGIAVAISENPFQLHYYYKNQHLLSEKQVYQNRDSQETIEFSLKSKEKLWGGGARAIGMNRRGHRLELYNKAHYGYETKAPLLNYTLPVVLSSNKYMVHFDNVTKGFMDLDSQGDDAMTYEMISGPKRYQVVAGDNYKKLISSYTELTGRQPMPALWTLGNFASRFGYHSQKEVQEVVAKYKKEQIPLDVVILDIYWFGKDIKGTMGNLEFYKDSFPEPTRMIADLKSDGIKTVLITEPFILKTSKRWQEAVDKDMLATRISGEPYIYDFYFGTTGLIDVFDQGAGKWFWEVYKSYIDQGVAGWWGDLGEPEVHPSDLQHKTGTADQVHNIYGHHWSKLIAEGYQKDFPKQRPFILMRAGYSGSQRYGMVPWSGDVNRSWGGLQAQPEILLQMGMQGLGYMHSDLGGFAGGEVFDPELYIRWLQYGVFQPIFRPHGQEHIASEPVFHDKRTIKLAKKAIELRYQLLPYNYTLAYENHTTGIPLMRPLLIDDNEAKNESLFLYKDSYLWGEDILVTPILFSEVKTKEIYFPRGSDWIDFYDTSKKYSGGSRHTVEVAGDHIPTYVREGSFIPMTDKILRTDEYNPNKFTLHYYNFTSATEKSSGQLYQDDGTTAGALEQGNFELIYFSSERKKKQTIINLQRENKMSRIANSKAITLVLHNLQGEPKKFKIDGQKFPYAYSSDTKVLTTELQWSNTQTHLKIEIKL